MKKYPLFLTAIALLSTQTKAAQNETYSALQLFGRVLERVAEEYVDSVALPNLVEKALNGMLQGLDPNSSYLGTAAMKDMKEQTGGIYDGIGVEIEMEDHAAIVIAPYEQTPAAKAGLQTGDIITHIDDTPTRGLNIDSVTEKLKGKVGTSVRLTLARKGVDPFVVTVERQVIKVPAARSERFNNIGYIRILTFMNIHTADEVQKEFEKMNHESPLEGLILDMRDNPGGLFDEGLKVAGLFLPTNKEVVASKGRNAKDIRRYYTNDAIEIAKNIPLLILVNGGTASSAEIVTAALQDHKRAIVMGTNTFGKGTVQSIIYLKGGNEALRLTTGRYITPSGKTLERGKGITPDLLVPLHIDPNNKIDDQMRRALELINGLVLYQNMVPK